MFILSDHESEHHIRSSNVAFTQFFQKEFLADASPLLRTSGDISSGFKSHSGQPCSHSVKVYVLPLTCAVCHLHALISQIHLWFSRVGKPLGSHHGMAAELLHPYTCKQALYCCLTACDKTDPLPTELSPLRIHIDGKLQRKVSLSQTFNVNRP